MAVIDLFTYNGEQDILDLHLHILDKEVDKFIIVEAKTTFSGKPKPLYFSNQEKFFQAFCHKMEYYVIDEKYTPEEIDLAQQSRNTRGAAHWKREFLQKESIKKALEYYKVQDDDLCYIGDVDEIWQPFDPKVPTKLKLRVYAYYLNNRSSEEFWGTLVAYYNDIKDQTLNHLRTNPGALTDKYYGWHFTSMGGLEQVRRKLNDSYTRESYNTREVQNLLEARHSKGLDYLGRPFTFELNEDDWPDFLTRNRYEYERLCKPDPSPTGTN